MSRAHFQLLPDLFCVVFFPPSFSSCCFFSLFFVFWFFFDGSRIVFEVQECFKGMRGGARCGRGPGCSQALIVSSYGVHGIGGGSGRPTVITE